MGDPNPGIGVATAESPQGPFKDKGKIFDSKEIGVNNSIDPFFYKDDEGRNYLFWGSFHGIYGIEMSQDGLQTQGEKFQIAGDAYEAPYIIEKEGAFYFFGSRGSCCEGENSTYNVAVARSDELKGHYVDKDGKDLLNNGGTEILAGYEDSKFVGPGHNAIIQDDEGRDWILYHAIDRTDPLLWTGASRRPLMLDPIIWEEGWPTVQRKTPSENDIESPQFN
ncbi:family 43 glycosylhydrolase [Halobacillus amylolyticus]|uniref:family 43 glycosylhydrolase n=1 Tax=Halobacillus amylolyticus TaxID=2932259 RepID=UPI0037BF48D2